MARKAEFDRREVLQKAMDVFWREGYHKSSISSLVTATHLQPGSLYAAFNSKEGLFLATLENYSRQSINKLQNCLDQADTPLQGVRRFVEKIVDEMLSRKPQRGCLLVNSVLEMSPGQTVINQSVNKHLNAIESRLISALVSAHEVGELASDKNPEVLAKYLMVNIWGLRVLAKTNPDHESVRAILVQILACL